MRGRNGVLKGWIWLAIFLLVTIGAQAEAMDMERMAWLGGCWQAESGDAGSGEQWMPLAGGTLLGVSRTVQDGRTVAFEFMEMRAAADGAVELVAHPSGQKRTVFKLVRLTGTSMEFANPGHDFPQRVGYARHGDAGVVGYAEGVRGGETRRIEFPMQRVDCEGQ